MIRRSTLHAVLSGLLLGLFGSGALGAFFWIHGQCA